MNYLKYFKQMKGKFKFVCFAAIAVFLYSCKKDEAVTCTTCTSPDTLTFELCKESDGNASVNGENTGVSYNVYISDLQESGVNCANKS